MISKLYDANFSSFRHHLVQMCFVLCVFADVIQYNRLQSAENNGGGFTPTIWISTEETLDARLNVRATPYYWESFNELEMMKTFSIVMIPLLGQDLGSRAKDIVESYFKMFYLLFNAVGFGTSQINEDQKSSSKFSSIYDTLELNLYKVTKL